ncbi:MAG: hypothetical protein NT069_10225, partial [Planctomycetota bacterium]|nr:hypothetical protein [Planctomycetota bacterium]
MDFNSRRLLSVHLDRSGDGVVDLIVTSIPALNSVHVSVDHDADGLIDLDCELSMDGDSDLKSTYTLRSESTGGPAAYR